MGEHGPDTMPKRAYRILSVQEGPDLSGVLGLLDTPSSTDSSDPSAAPGPGEKSYALTRIDIEQDELPEISGFDAVLLLWSESGTQSLGAVCQIQSAAPHIPLLVITSGTEDEHTARALQCGAQEVLLHESLDRSELERAIAHSIERQRRTARLELDVSHDPLTGLPGRPLFLENIAQTLKRSQRIGGEECAVLLLNLDRFRLINDSLGPTYGDQLLVALTRRMKRCLRPSDKIARLGGGDFAILISELEGVHHVRSLCQSLQRETSAPFLFGDHEVLTTASIGVAHSDRDYSEPEDLLRDAGVALHNAKARGAGQTCTYEPAMHDATVARFKMEMELRSALDRNEFLLHYQPIVDLPTESLIGFEALLRWQHPSGRMIGPDKFIPVAEETGLIVPMERWVLQQTCEQIRYWRDLLPPTHPLSLHVNISGLHLARAELASELSGLFKKNSLDPQWLRIEITESAVAENPDAAIELLGKLHDLGCQLSVDDFGTGYSSLACLQRYPVDVLKVDRSFIAKIADTKADAALVRTILELARGFNLDVIAEGIETKEQADILLSQGYELGQGFYYCRPVDEERAREIVLASARGEKIRPAERKAA